jgi:hypothetical protein
LNASEWDGRIVIELSPPEMTSEANHCSTAIWNLICATILLGLSSSRLVRFSFRAEDGDGNHDSRKTLLAELGGFCDDDAPVCLVSFALPGISPEGVATPEPPERILYGTPHATCRSGSGSRRSLVSQQSKSRYSVNRQITSLPVLPSWVPRC